MIQTTIKLYGVCIGDYVAESNFMFCKAKNKTEARSDGMRYKRAWGVRDPILKIVEIPESIEADDEARRKHAVSA